MSSTSERRTRADRLSDRFEAIDRAIAGWMGRWGVPTLRVALGVVFVWFGALKPFGLSPAADLIAATVYVVPAETFVPILGIWEVAIGICLLYRPLIRVGILLLALQLPGTFLPLVLLPEATFTVVPIAPTLEGQYIVKNSSSSARRWSSVRRFERTFRTLTTSNDPGVRPAPPRSRGRLTPRVWRAPRRSRGSPGRPLGSDP